MRLRMAAPLLVSLAAASCSAPGFGSAPKPLVAAPVWPLISGAWEGSPHPNGAASWLRLSAGLAGVAGCSTAAACAVGPGSLGDRSRSLPCAGGGSRRHSAVRLPRGGAASGANGVTWSDMRSGAIKVSAQCPVAGPLRHIRQDSVCNVLAHVPAPPSPIINLINSNSNNPPAAPLAPKYWVFKRS